MNRKVIGADKHIKRLRAIRDIEDEAINVLLETGELVRQEAMRSIRDGTVRGRGHVPSLPGQPPKGDTGQLELGIVVELRKSEKTVNVISTAIYSAALEFGTSRIAERPFMRPALRKHRSRLVTGMVEALQGKIRVLKGG